MPSYHPQRIEPKWQAEWERNKTFRAIDLDHGAGYGNTLTWASKSSQRPSAQPVEIQVDLDLEKFYRMFAALMTSATPER